MISNVEKVGNILKIGSYNVMHRINHNGKRLYIQDTPFKHYVGLTGALSHVTFVGDNEHKRLDSWRKSFIDQHGSKTLDDYVEMTADFGSLLHESIVLIKEKGFINWKEEADRAENYFLASYKNKNITPDSRTIKSMVNEYQYHVSSLMQWVYEMVEEIYAIETPAKLEHLCIATPIDVYCKAKPTPKTVAVNTTVNIKTSNQISNHQWEQVSCEMFMWNETYGGAERTGLIRTKQWKKQPTYEYKTIDMGEATFLFNNVKSRLELCFNSNTSYYPNTRNKVFDGVTKIGEPVIIKEVTLEEEWTSMEN